MKELSKSFISLILLGIVFWLAVCILRALIKRLFLVSSSLILLISHWLASIDLSLHLMFHGHRVPLFVIQSLLCSFNVLAHLCASHPLNCKCSAYPRLPLMIIVFAVYQVWSCPQVWCCLIRHEGA
jgi:hypothetical protein